MRENSRLVLCSYGNGNPEQLPVLNAALLRGATLVLSPPGVPSHFRRLLRPPSRWTELPSRRLQPGEALWSTISNELEKNGFVVRLYPDDPMLDADGVWEAKQFAAAGFPMMILPGLSLLLASAAYAGIPLFAEGMPTTLFSIDEIRSDTVLPSHNGNIAIKIPSGAELGAIAHTLRGLGLDADVPYAIVRNAGLASQTVEEGTLRTLQGESKDRCALFIGSVVRERNAYIWYERLPLFGKRVLITRAKEQAAEFSRAMRILGAEPIEFPTIEIGPPDDSRLVTDAVERLSAGNYDWVVFTSVNGVDIFLHAIQSVGKDARTFGAVQIAAIGKATAERLRAAGLRADFVPERFIAEDVLAGLLDRGAAGKRVLLPRAAEARDVLPDGLRAAGARVDVVPIYKTVPAAPRPETLRRIENGEIDIITLTSSSTARNLVRLLDGRVDLLNRSMIACIGPITAETARALGLRVDLVAEEYSLDGLVNALIAATATATATRRSQV